MRYHIAHPLAGIVLLTILLLPAAALAQAWQWQMSLKVDAPNSMYLPGAVAFDPASERYYVVDAGRNRLVSFGRDGTMLRAFTADDRLKAPFDMVRLDDGKLWVVEKGRNSLTLIDIPAKVVKPHTVRDGERQVFPDRIAQKGGTLFILDRASGQVLRLAADLGVAQRFDCPDCIGGFADFALVGDGLWALEPRSKKLFRFDAAGAIVQTVNLGSEVDFPVSLAVEAAGIIYVLDRHQNSVLAYSEDGQFRYRFLGPGHARGQVHFARQLRFDPWGQLCVVDEGGGRVEIFAR